MISARQIEKLAIDNSPVLLTAVGVVGTIGTAVLASRGGVRYDRVMAQVDRGDLFEMTKKDKAKLAARVYGPTVISGSVTIGAIIMANRIGTKRAAALAAAYTLSERAYTEYRDKVIEKIGDRKEAEIREEIVRERLQRNPQTEDNTVIVGSGDVLCYEMYTGRYFNSSVEEIKKAVNDTNYSINADGYASLQDFYDRIGLPRTSVSEEMGWTSDKLMDVDFQPVLAEDGRPCVGINFMTGPIRDYRRFH